MTWPTYVGSVIPIVIELMSKVNYMLVFFFSSFRFFSTLVVDSIRMNVSSDAFHVIDLGLNFLYPFQLVAVRSTQSYIKTF